MTKNYYLAPRARYDLASKALGIPIFIRFSYKGDEAWLETGLYIKNREYWNDSLKSVVGGPNFKLKNRVIDKYLQEAEARILQAILDGAGPSIYAFRGNSLPSLEDYINEVDKSNCAMGVIKSMKLFHGKVQKPNSIKRKELKKKIATLKLPEITTITIQWLRKLEDYMVSVQGLTANSIKGYMMTMSKVMKQALKEGYITSCPIGPGKYEVPAAGKTIPTFLVDEERDNVLDHLLYHRSKFEASTYIALAYFSLGCYSGLRYSDWALFDINKHIEGNHILLRTKKTDGLVSKEITGELAEVLNVIKQVGPLTLSYEAILKELDEIQTILKLEKGLTTHVARHSFGYMCASRGVSMEATAYMMGISVQIVKHYYHYTGKHMEEQTKKLAVKKIKNKLEPLQTAEYLVA